MPNNNIDRRGFRSKNNPKVNYRCIYRCTDVHTNATRTRAMSNVHVHAQCTGCNSRNFRLLLITFDADCGSGKSLYTAVENRKSTHTGRCIGSMLFTLVDGFDLTQTVQNTRSLRDGRARIKR